MTKLARIAIVITLLANAPAFSAATSEPVQIFKKSWVAHALQLQREIDLALPLNQASFIGTHNSENSISYQIPLVRYVDPNQNLSIYDQLEMGVRSIEFDVHWYFNTRLKHDILLSHALDNHAGCSAFDRPVVDGLQELKEWLQRNPNEVVILYFDRGRALEGHEPRLATYVQTYLGDFIYKPAMVRDRNQVPGSCVVLPATLSKSTILAAHKQLVVITKGCDGTDPNYAEKDTYPSRWNDIVFAGASAIPGHEFSIMDSSLDKDFTPFPDCSKSTTFKDDLMHAAPWRIFEDRTMMSRVVGHPQVMTTADVSTMVNCGINWPTFDMLMANDERLTAAVWSWAPGYPQDGAGSCAMLDTSKGVMNQDCQTVARAYACKNSLNEFKVIRKSGTWSSGESICQAEAGKDWHFSMPLTGSSMYELKRATLTSNAQGVWVNYQEAEGGHWQAK